MTPPEPTPAELAAATAALIAKNAYQTQRNTETQLQLESVQKLTALAKERQAPSAAIAAAAQADQAAREKAWIEALTKLVASEGKFPTGNYTVASEAVTTPAGVALAARATRAAAKAVATAVADELKGKTLVFVNELPLPEDTFRFRYFEAATTRLHEQLESTMEPLRQRPEFFGLQPGRYGALLPVAPGMDAALAAVVPAIVGMLPALVNIAAGLFRTDVSERVAPVSIPESAVVAAFVAELHAIPSCASNAAYPSWEAYTMSQPLGVETFETVKRMEKLAQLKIHLPRLIQDLEASAGTVPERAELSAPIGARLKALNDEVNALTAKLDNPADPVPMSVTLCREECWIRARTGPGSAEVRFVVVKTALRAQSTIQRKTFWKQSYEALTCIALEYRIGDTSGKILKGGLKEITYGRPLNELPKTTGFIFD